MFSLNTTLVTRIWPSWRDNSDASDDASDVVAATVVVAIVDVVATMFSVRLNSDVNMDPLK